LRLEKVWHNSGMSAVKNKVDAPCELQLEVWKRPLAEIAREYGIPLRRLMTRIRNEEICIPPPEYWETIVRGLTRVQALKKIGWTPQMIGKVNEILRSAREKKKGAKRKVRK